MVWYDLCTPSLLYLHYFYMLSIIVMTTLAFTIFMFLVIMFIFYFDYILSIARLSICLCISSYSALSGHCVSVVLIRCLPADTPYILGQAVDRGCNTPVESFAVHFPNIGASRVPLRRKNKLCS
jgi:hypothetical protein